jgi:hypothetical protein
VLTVLGRFCKSSPKMHAFGTTTTHTTQHITTTSGNIYIVFMYERELAQCSIFYYYSTTKWQERV